MSTPEQDSLPKMKTHSPLADASLKPILKIALRSAVDGLLWLGKVALFVATLVTVSITVTLLATTLFGAIAVVIAAGLYLRYVPIRPPPLLYYQ